MKYKNIFLPSYSIGVEVYTEVPRLCQTYGTKVVFIGGKTALTKASHKVKAILQDSNLTVLDELWYGGEACYQSVEQLKQHQAVKEADIIFAFGGGKALDTCKVLTGQLGKPLFTFPTIASTCAAVTSICALYTKEGEFNGVYHRPKPAEHTFINTAIIANAPVKYLWAGIGDTLAKGYEPEFAARGKTLGNSDYTGILLSQLCSAPVLKYGAKALQDCKNHLVSPALEEIILAIIVNTGLASIHLNANYNTCIAHALCYGFTTIPKVEEQHLHGEIVSYGVLVQLMLDKHPDLDKLIPFYQRVELPLSYKNFGLSFTDLEGVFDKATVVDDIKVAAFEINKEKLKQAVLNLEDYLA